MKRIEKLESIKDIQRIEALGVMIEFEPQEEDIAPDFDDEELAKEVCRRYSNGNMASWFCAKVSAKYRGLEADDYLGCCSYGSFKEFLTMEKYYYMDMINKCIEQINRDIDFANLETQKWWDVRRAKNLVGKHGMFVVSTLQINAL